MFPYFQVTHVKMKKSIFVLWWMILIDRSMTKSPMVIYTLNQEKKDIKRKGKERKRKTSNTPPHRRENPGIPVRSPSKPTNNLFLLILIDLPCKRTRRGKGRFTKFSTTTSSPNIHSTIHTEHFPSKILVSFFNPNFKNSTQEPQE